MKRHVKILKRFKRTSSQDLSKRELTRDMPGSNQVVAMSLSQLTAHRCHNSQIYATTHNSQIVTIVTTHSCHKLWLTTHSCCNVSQLTTHSCHNSQLPQLTVVMTYRLSQLTTVTIHRCQDSQLSQLIDVKTCHNTHHVTSQSCRITSQLTLQWNWGEDMFLLLPFPCVFPPSDKSNLSFWDWFCSFQSIATHAPSLFKFCLRCIYQYYKSLPPCPHVVLYLHFSRRVHRGQSVWEGTRIQNGWTPKGVAFDNCPRRALAEQEGGEASGLQQPHRPRPTHPRPTQHCSGPINPHMMTKSGLNLPKKIRWWLHSRERMFSSIWRPTLI